MKLFIKSHNPTYTYWKGSNMELPTRTVVWIVLIAAFSYHLYTPVPDNAKEIWKQRFTLAAIQFVEDLSHLGQLLGFSSGVNITRTLTDTAWILNPTPGQDALQVYDDVVDGVKVRIYKLVGSKQNQLGIINIHGGGWSILNLDVYDGFTRDLALKTGAVTMSVDYRLSPEHPYPIPLDDCVTATKYFLKNAHKFGVDKTRIAIIGDSAGGNLAMAVSLKISEDPSVPNLKVQALIYPALQALDFNTPSYQQYSDQERRAPSIASKEALLTYWQYYAFGKLLYTSDFAVNNHTSSTVKSKVAKYLDHEILPKEYRGDLYRGCKNSSTNEEVVKEVESLFTNPYFSPLMASDEQLSKQPNTYILTTEYDALRDDGYFLANRLKHLNVPHRLDHYDGIGHGFCLMLKFDEYPIFLSKLVDYFQSNL